MKFEPEILESLAERKPLELLRDTERSLRDKTLSALVPILPENVALTLGEASAVADESLEELAEIDLDDITDAELQPIRIRMGLAFVGFGALMVIFLLLYLQAKHPELSPIQQMHRYWHQYVWFVSLGVAGMFMLGREAMRPPIDEA